MTQNPRIAVSARDPIVARYLLRLLRKKAHMQESPTYIINLQHKCIRNGISKRRVRTVVRNGFRGRLLLAFLCGTQDDMYDIISDALACGVEDQFLERSVQAMREDRLLKDQMKALKAAEKLQTVPSPDHYVQ